MSGEVESSPDEEASLPGGGVESTYHGAEGVEMKFKTPPSEFTPKSATDEELELYGFPPRPEAGEPQARKNWEETIGRITSTSPAGGCMGVAEPIFGPLEVSERETSKWSGYATLAKNAPANQWRSARAEWKIPKLSDTCRAPAGLTSWVGVGGRQNKGFFQAGVSEPYELVEGFEATGWVEYFRAGEEGDNPESENPYHYYRAHFKPGDDIFVIVEWKPALQEMYMRVLDLDSGRSTPGTFIDPFFGDVYDGQSVDYVGAEVQENEAQQNFGSYKIKRAEALVTKENNWKKFGELGSLTALDLKHHRKQELYGPILASPGPIHANQLGFTEHWRHC